MHNQNKSEISQNHQIPGTSLKTRNLTTSTVTDTRDKAMSLPSAWWKHVHPVFKFTSLAEDWKQHHLSWPQHQERKRIHSMMELSRNLDCSSELFALCASAALLVLLPGRDHHWQCAQLAPPGAFFPLWVCLTPVSVCLPCAVTVTEPVAKQAWPIP